MSREKRDHPINGARAVAPPKNFFVKTNHGSFSWKPAVAGCGVYGGVIHRVMALPPGVEEASCILAARSHRS